MFELMGWDETPRLHSFGLLPQKEEQGKEDDVRRLGYRWLVATLRGSVTERPALLGPNHAA